MRNAECKGEVKARIEGRAAIPHSTFRIPHCYALTLRRPLPMLINTPVATSATNKLDRP